MADEEVCLRNTGKVKRRQRRPERRCFYVAGCLFLLLLFAAFGVLIALLLVVGWQEPRVATTSGVIDGLFDPDFHLFSFRASFSDHLFNTFFSVFEEKLFSIEFVLLWLH